MTAETTHPQHDVNSPENLARRERGLEVARSVDGEAAQAVIDSLADISPALGHHIAAFGFGDVYARPDLDHAAASSSRSACSRPWAAASRS